MTKLAIILTAYILATPVLAQEILVIDGDTFELDGQMIQLWGIDAPELDQTCMRGDEELPIGETASLFLQIFLTNLTHCEPQYEDSHGRTVARCYAFMPQGDIGRSMVVAGQAWDHERYSGGEYAQAEEWARSQGTGVWGPGRSCIAPWEWRSGI